MDVSICVIKEETEIFFPYTCLKIISERTHKRLQIMVSSREWVKVEKREKEICFSICSFLYCWRCFLSLCKCHLFCMKSLAAKAFQKPLLKPSL